MKKLFGALCVLILFAVALVAQQNATIPTMTSREYNGLKKDQVFVVMFSAPYCGPCHAAERTMMTALTKKYEIGRASCRERRKTNKRNVVKRCVGHYVVAYFCGGI